MEDTIINNNVIYEFDLTSQNTNLHMHCVPEIFNGPTSILAVLAI